MNKEYLTEAKEKWGATQAYKEYENKTETYSKEDFNSLTEGLNTIMKNFAICKQEGNSPESPNAQATVKELQKYITKNFYTCTVEILKGLGAMYVADERFKDNIDKYGAGTAQFMCDAIMHYCP